jgi:hypothetical protein
VVWKCRKCDKRVVQKDGTALFVNVVRGRRVVERWAECGECRQPGLSAKTAAFGGRACEGI